MKKIGKELKSGTSKASILKSFSILWVFLIFFGDEDSLVGAIEIGLTVDENPISLGEEFSIQIRVDGSEY